MKKRTIAILMIIALLSVSLMPAAAESTAKEASEIIYLDDGSYIEISGVRTIETGKSSRATTTTIGAKDVTFKNTDGEVEWTYTLTGYFTYDPGVSSTCTNATYTSDINANGWTLNNATATRSGNTAYGVGVYIKKVLFIKVNEIDIDISISCDSYGNLS